MNVNVTPRSYSSAETQACPKYKVHASDLGISQQNCLHCLLSDLCVLKRFGADSALYSLWRSVLLIAFSQLLYHEAAKLAAINPKKR